jgi:hypothetical protein
MSRVTEGAELIQIDFKWYPRLYEVEECSEGQKRASFCHLA